MAGSKKLLSTSFICLIAASMRAAITQLKAPLSSISTLTLSRPKKRHISNNIFLISSPNIDSTLLFSRISIPLESVSSTETQQSDRTLSPLLPAIPFICIFFKTITIYVIFFIITNFFVCFLTLTLYFVIFISH